MTVSCNQVLQAGMLQKTHPCIVPSSLRQARVLPQLACTLHLPAVQCSTKRVLVWTRTMPIGLPSLCCWMNLLPGRY